MSEAIDGLRQRLVGAFVILTLAVIFLPMIFDKPHVEGSSIIVPVPPKPEFKIVEISKPKKPEFKELVVDPIDNKVKKVTALPLVNSVSSESQKASRESLKRPAPPKTATKKDDAVKQREQVDAKKVTAQKSTTVAKGVGSKATVSHLPIFKNVWMVQLGTFSDKGNAYRLRDTLRKDGFDGHTKIVRYKDKEVVRVFTGPFVNKREAQKTKKRLDKKYKVDSRIIFFDA